MDRIIGNFYFKRTSSGNLLGEYTNADNQEIFTETSVPDDNNDNPFVGNYISIWVEKVKDDPCTSKLQIESNGENKFKLRWKNKNKVLFYGEGFIVDDILIGFYVEGPL